MFERFDFTDVVYRYAGSSIGITLCYIQLATIFQGKNSLQQNNTGCLKVISTSGLILVDKLCIELKL